MIAPSTASFDSGFSSTPACLRESLHLFDQRRHRTSQDWRDDPRSKALLPPLFQNSAGPVQTISGLPPVCLRPARSPLKKTFRGCARSRVGDFVKSQSFAKHLRASPKSRSIIATSHRHEVTEPSGSVPAGTWLSIDLSGAVSPFHQKST